MDIRLETARHPLPGGELRLLGAVNSVTAAMTLVDLDGTRILVDCGMAQGAEAKRWRFPDEALTADAVVLTHGHNDHVGSLPELWRAGWRGPVLATPATLEIARIVLDDGFGLQDREHELPGFMKWLGERSRPLMYNAEGWPIEGFKGRLALRDAGHILGSASLEIATRQARVILSGDLGRPGTPILRDYNLRWNAEQDVDLVVMESTYGDRRHVDTDFEERLLKVLRRAQSAGGHILVPAFAIGRTQTLLYFLNDLVERGEVDDLPVAVDTPMGLRVTETYRKFRRMYDREALARISDGDDPLLFDDLYAVNKGRDSVRLRDVEGPMLILAGSGMCTGGRILGHLEELLPREETTVLFVGFQAPGTPGREIQSRGTGGSVQLNGSRIPIRATIETLEGLSAHADQEELAAWLRAIPNVKAVALHHGEPEAQRALRTHLTTGSSTGSDPIN